MSDAALNELLAENTPTASPSLHTNQELSAEDVGIAGPAVDVQDEVPYGLEAPSTPVPQTAIVSSPNVALTRTVAIIKPHALSHRFDIEHRLSEAGFEIVKERQMEFDVETDPETMYELFGDDYECFVEGPVWVYVLERRRAIEVWATLMGDPDPTVARQDTPTALRALYGVSLQQNAVMGSPDSPTAEMQISAIFASSPPFPTTDLPDVGSNFNSGSLRSVSSSVLSALRKQTSSDGGSANNGRTPFKARKLPATHAAPNIVPRMSRAAALRAGLPVEKTGGPRGPLSKERLAETFENVPGHKRTSTITVASTAPPAVAPRMTRAAALRLGLSPPEKDNKRASLQLPVNGNAKIPEEGKATFDGVPGHKRRETITVASTKTPSVMPRTNRSASLRQLKDTAPPTSFMFRTPSNQGPSRSTSRTSFNGTSTSRSSISRPPSAQSIQPTPSRPVASRIASTTSVKSGTSTTQRSTSRPSTSASVTSQPIPTANGDKQHANGTGRPKPRPSSAQAPAITPRTNKSALLRAQKMAAAAVAAAKPKSKPVATPKAVKV